MAEDQAKRIDELVEHLASMGNNVPIDTVKPVVEALKAHGELVALLAKSNERLLRASEKMERWTTASVFLAFTLAILTLALLFVAELQGLGPDVRQTLPNWAATAWPVFLVVAGVAFAFLMVFAIIYFAKAVLVLPKRRG